MGLLHPDFFALALAYGLDLIIGDPGGNLHPVRIMGKAILWGEQLERRYFRGARAEKIAGTAIAILIAGGSSLLVYCAVKGANQLHYLFGLALSIYFFYAMIAIKDMVLHIQRVKEALEKNDLMLARERVALLVSRDTGGLGESEVARAALESLFESTADGVFAPLFYAALGGPALAVFYKAVNTLDSMLGYKTKRYYYLGWASARLDDLLGFIPARLTAITYILAGKLSGLNWKKSWETLLKDRKKHESPNSAWPEAAAAGALDVRLGGIDRYRGQEKHRPIINETGKKPRSEDLATALALFKKTSFFSLLIALLLIVAKMLILTRFLI